MSFYFKSYNNNDYNYYSTNVLFYENVFVEIEGYSYLLGSIYSEIMQKRLAYVSKRDADGNIIFEKGLYFEDLIQDHLRITNIFKLPNGNFVLTIFDHNKALMICLSHDFESIIWKKKYFDKEDSSEMSSQTYLSSCLLSNGEVLMTIRETSGYPWISNYHFLNINTFSGEVNFSKKLVLPENNYFLINEIKPFNSNIILIGDIQNLGLNTGFVITISRDISVIQKWVFNLMNLDEYTQLSVQGISNIYNNRLMLVGAKYGSNARLSIENSDSSFIQGSSQQGSDGTFILEVDLSNGFSKPGLYIDGLISSSKSQIGIYDGNNLHFSDGGSKLLKISLTNNQFLWGKYIEEYPRIHIIESNSVYSTSNYSQSIRGSYVFSKLDKDYNSCKSIVANSTYSIETFLPRLSQYEIPPLIANSLQAYDLSNITTINILGGQQSDICPPTYDYNLKLEYSNISAPHLTQNQQILETYVGDITVSNTGTLSATIIKNTVIATENGVTFKTENDDKIISEGGSSIIKVFISGTPTHTGNFSPLIEINSPYINNPNVISIPFIVNEEVINAEIIDSSNLFYKEFTKGLPNSFPDESYGYFVVRNYTKTRSLIINAQNIFVKEGFVFAIPFTEIPAEGSVIIPVSVRANDTIQSQAGGHAATIVIPFVINPQSQHKIIFEVKDEPLDIRIIGLTIEQQPLTFIQGLYYHPKTPRIIGKLKIKNFTQTREFTLGSTTLDNPDNLEFKSRAFTLKRFNEIGNEKEVDIVVSLSATATGNFVCQIDLTQYNITNPNQYNIPFTVVEDILDVEITNAELRFPHFVKDLQVIDRSIGTITLQNNSSVKSFTLEVNTKIHYTDNIAGLVFQTVNNTPISIAAGGNSETFEIELRPSYDIPKQFGHFYAYIVISGVKNFVPFLLDFDVFNSGIDVDTNSNTSLQSSSFALQAVGSKGIDSPKGIQLRWLFGGNLGNKHLPKGDLVLNNQNYNKPNDYVNVYKAPYTTNVRVRAQIDLSKKPFLVNNSQQYWLYKMEVPISNDDDTTAKFVVNERMIYVYFRNKQKYKEVREVQLINPLENPKGFITAYGENIIEIESKEDLFFRVTPVTNKTYPGDLYLEVLSVEENKLVTSKFLSYRKKMTPTEVRNAKIFAENGRSIRFKKQGTPILAFDFEFYSDFIASASYWKAWQDYGKYAITNTSNIKALNNLLGDINGKWFRYNDGEFVKKQNYIDKWNYISEGFGDSNRGIREIVEKYLSLSSNASNPRAEEYLNINFSDPNGEIITEPTNVDDQDEATLISYLDLLNVAAMDYHIARLLGLGILDADSEDEPGSEFIYLTEYKTLKDVHNEIIPKSCQLLSMSLPTSINTERLPLPIEIAELYKGIPHNQNEDIPVFYDEEGYTFDGKNRLISIINKPLPSAEKNPTFFSSSSFWDASFYSLPIYAGLEYKITDNSGSLTAWKKPELSHDTAYKNIKSDGSVSSFETIPIMLPENFGDPLFTHRQNISGTYLYSTYGINIFSRAKSSNFNSTIVTEIKPKNTLLPPSEIKAWLIQPEKPLMFTSQFEQEKYAEIEGEDKTFVRINFDYNAYQDLVTHSIPLDSGIEDIHYINYVNEYFPDKYDIFADHIETYYRKETPKSISARLYEVTPITSDNLCAVFKTKQYHLSSTGETLFSILPPDTTFHNFIGSVFVVNNKSYVIKNIAYGINGLDFTVYKEEVSRAILSGGSISGNYTSLTLPATSGNDLFVVTENMQSTLVWGDKNPNSYNVPLEFPEIKREIITSTSENGTVQKYLEKSRGFWSEEEATIEKFEENGIHKGIYKIIFPDLGLIGTPLDVSTHSFYEMNNGCVRVFRNKYIERDNFVKSRDVLKVIRTEIFGRNTRVLYVYDNEFKFDENGNPSNNIYADEIQTGVGISINYYPSYFLYLYRDTLNDLTEETILPTGDNLIKYSVFGLRSVDIDNDLNGNIYKSKFSAPTIVMGQKITDPEPPEKPLGSLYATRPDFYGKATYSFTTKFNHKPYGVQLCRTDNNALLSALYEQQTIEKIYESLSTLGGNDEKFLTNRWNNFFDYETLKSDGEYKAYPEQIGTIEEVPSLPEEMSQEKNELDGEERPPAPTIQSYAFPPPNKIAFFDGINIFIDIHNSNTNQSVPHIDKNNFGLLNLNDTIIAATNDNDQMLLIDFIKEVLEYTFVPLTEVPVVYQHVKNLPYLPLNKKQNIRDKSGYLLKPPIKPNDNSDFDMAPMMTILDEAQNISLFSDFTLNGTTNNLYFYASREIGSQMTMSELSSVLGPVKIVEANAPEAPKILSGLPILENKTLGITPKIKIEIHPYPEISRIKKINLYRSNNRLDAESVLSMEKVQQLVISEIEVSESGTWTIYDYLENFEQIPYGDPLFYRVTVEKEMQYADPQLNSDGTSNIIIDAAPSQASKIMALMLTETQNPDSPLLEGSGIRPIDADFVNNVKIEWNQTCYKGIYHLYSLSSQGNWKEIVRLIVNDTNDKVQLNMIANENILVNKEVIDIVDGKIIFPLEFLGVDYDRLPLFDEDGNRKYYHFKIVAENTSNMFSTEENILTLFTDDVWDNLQGISVDGFTDGMIIGKTFIIK